MTDFYPSTDDAGNLVDSAGTNGTSTTSVPSSQASAAAGGRDAFGRFAAGNKRGPGNPFARRVAALRQAMLDVVKPDDLQAIIVRLVLAAQQGDVAAARLVLAYTLGKPAPTVDPDALDLAEWGLWQQMPVSPEVLEDPQALGHLPRLQAHRFVADHSPVSG